MTKQPKWTADEGPRWSFGTHVKNLFDQTINAKKIKPSVDTILNGVLKFTDLTDWGDERFLKGLTHLTESVRDEANLHSGGKREYINGMAFQVLVRMKIIADFKANPEILQTPVERPLIITGLPRTGTSFLHWLLASDPKARPLLYWELIEPSPAPEPETYENDPRIELATASTEYFYKTLPGLAKIHRVEATAPDECNGLFMREFASNLYFYFYNCPSYVHWYMNTDQTGAYQFYKQQLQLLSWKFPPGRHWALKAPSHLYCYEALLANFPDACIVQTHRDPATILPSACSLAALTRKMATLSKNVKYGFVGKQWQEHLALATEAGIKAREKLDPARFLDISYRSLIADPVATVKSIYKYFGYEFNQELEENITKLCQEKPQNKFGKHVYSLDQFELKENEIRNRFEQYSAVYSDYL